MEPVLVYGYPAGSSMGLIAALEWLDQPYRLTRVDMLGEMREASYGRLNPRHETPVLVSSTGAPLTETMAIAAHLEARDKSRRISFEPDSPDADRMHQFMGFVNTGFTGAFSALWTAFELARPDPAYQAALQRFGREAVIERHDKLEAMMGDSPYLIGERPTLADALLIGVARWLDLHEVADRRRWPKLDALRSRLEADKAVQFASALENGDPPPYRSRALQGHVPLERLIEISGR